MPLKVLLADDSMTAQNMGKKILTDAGYQVIAVSNGAQALKKLASEKPDLVVLDVYMPGYSGLEVCERIKNAPDTARIPVVLCVAKMEPFKPEEGTRVRADAVIVKPFEATDLVARVQELGANTQRRARQKVFEQEPAAADTEATDISEQTPPVEHVNVPQELAVEPAVGMELVTEEPAPDAGSAAPFPANFEIEHEREPVETIGDPRMQGADGLSGVFELPPSQPSQEPAPEFEIVAQPNGSVESPADDVRGQAAKAALVEPRPEFVVDRVSVSIPLKEPERLPEPQAPSAPAEPPAIKDFAEPMEQAPTATEIPTFVQPENSSSSGYTGIYEFAPPRGSLESPAVETRVGEVRGSNMGDLVEPMVSAPQAFSPAMESVSAVAVETAETSADETVSAVPLPVWVAEEVALDQGELNVSLEEEMRAALASTQTSSAAHVELPLGVAAERIAAFTEKPAELPDVEPYGQDETSAAAEPVELSANAAEMNVEQSCEERTPENFEALSDEIVCETSAAAAWYSSPKTSAPMPEPGAMDAVASLQGPVPEFSSEATVSPDFSIPGHSFDAVPVDEFGPPTSAPTVIEADIAVPERVPAHVTDELSQPSDAHTAQPTPSPAAEPTPAADHHALGAMAQAIVESPALSSLKGAEAEPVVEAIVTRMLEQIKPELVAHVLRELGKK